MASSSQKPLEITFSKKRKNRMLSDSAAAIAFRNSGNLNFFDEKNKLIDNESVVVYDERTSL